MTALAMLASVLVAVPAVAADPEPDYEATFSACAGVPTSDFEDVPSNHANAGDIDCIAYYGITKGTSATTYSPLMSVTRETMALFLTRLAATVEIDVDDDPDDPGFTDTGDLTDESQMAIAQLADLGITKGTSATTYSPADPVSRAQMAQFIARLMNHMSPMADGEIGLSSTTQYGYTPSDVAANDMDADVGTPFGDLGEATKDEFDAITQLYELGVASGISDTAYSPEADITRASMAGFMAAVLDHSNARPAGLSVQASIAEGWGDQEPTLAISVRDDDFGMVEDQAVDVFSSASPSNMGLREDGTFNFGTSADDVFSGDIFTGDCVWNDNDEATDVNGNIIMDSEVLAGNTRVFYAWIGDEDGDKFDADDVDEATVSVTAKLEQESLMGDSDINLHAHNAGSGKQVDLRNGRAVTATAQLKDRNSNDVERSGISIRVEYRQGEITAGERDSRSYVNTEEAILMTGDDGSVSFPVPPPANSTRVNDQERKDSVLFVELDANGNDTNRMDEVLIHWIEETPVLTSDSLDAPVYVLAGNPSVGSTVRLWDQYGNPHRSNPNQKAKIDYADSETGTEEDTADQVRQVISRGYARWATKIEVAENNTVGITYDVRQLARNSGGSPVRAGEAGTPAAEFVADFAAWNALGQGQSSSTRQALVDDFDVTYNDGRVIVDGDSDGDNDVDDADTASADPIYLAHTDDDNDSATGPEDDDDNPDDVDPVRPYARAVDSDRTDGIVPFLRNILNEDALDTYVDRGQMRTAPNDPDAGDATANDGMGTVYVVKKAISTDVGNDVLVVTHVLQSEGEFLTDSQASADSDSNPELVYSYDDDDIFIDSRGSEGVEITMARFEALIDDNSPNVAKNEGATYVQVIAYDVDGTSIFRVHGS